MDSDCTNGYCMMRFLRPFRGFLWAGEMDLHLLQGPEIADECISAGFHSAFLHFPKGSVPLGTTPA